MDDTEKVKRGEQCPHCGRYNSRHIVVNGIILNSKNEVFLIKRGIEPAYGEWALPGGYVDWDETFEEAMMREIREEVGLSLTIDRFFRYYDSTQRNLQNVAVTFVLKVQDNTSVTLQKEEVLEGRWFSFSNLPEHIAFDHRMMLEDYLRSTQ